MDSNLLEKSTKLFCQTIIYRIMKPSLSGLVKDQLTEVQLACTKYVSLHPEPSIGEIAEGLAISNAASAKLVDRLVRKKILTREEDDKDRRVLKINLTDKGKILLKDIIDSEKTMFEKVLNRMSTEDIAALKTGLISFLKAALENPAQIEEVCLRCGWEHILNCPGNALYHHYTGKDKPKV